MAAVSKPLCPCGSGRAYDGCCGPLHEGAPASSAEALMRSRFSAYALGLDAYVLSSWHPSTRPAELDLDDDVEWRRLQIVDCRGGCRGVPGVVPVAARGGLVHERSRFAHEDGHWYYVRNPGRVAARAG